MAGIEPYRFEPERVRNGEQEDSEGDEMNERLEGTFWCLCERCQVMPTRKECLCCREQPEAENKLEGISCITQNEDFSIVCLNRAVLRTAIVGFHYCSRSPLPSPTQNRNYRYAAYRQYIWWVYGKLGWKTRKVIPACVIAKIRKEFPDASGIYVGFKEADVTELDLAFFE